MICFGKANVDCLVASMSMIVKQITPFADDICNHLQRYPRVVLEDQVCELKRTRMSAQVVHNATLQNLQAECITDGCEPP